MNILYLGDIMGEIGVLLIEKHLPQLRRKYSLDIVIAQGENVTFGKGIIPQDYQRLKTAGVDFFTGGNHSLFRPEVYPLLNDPAQPIIRPANYPTGTAGLGYKYLKYKQEQILVVSLLGQIVGKSSQDLIDNPLKTIDFILDQEKEIKKSAIIVNFHGDFSSEKIVIGHYLDGKVTAIIGDHWHVPTADGRVLPQGTAHITDVGMCGILNSSLGVDYQIIIDRWRNNTKNRNILETKGPCQLNGVIINSEPLTGLANDMTSLNLILDNPIY